ncbi:MAG: dTDP-4-dehydrorhamnose 3,5-epimerase family protein [Dehalococcoidia bacterium]|nr:dTDP-4-dehydrorhamnose 3,5-epimerase family protein [Dehalococcoidia bacterium]
MIEGVVIKKLVRHADERGFLMEMLREDDEVFERFGQTYVSLNYPGVVRAWHYHRRQTDHFVAVKGMVKVALYDAREDSRTHGEVQEFFMGDHNPMLLKIPPGVYHGYKTTGVEPALLINFPTHVYDATAPDEFRVAWDTPDIPYDWSLKNE